MVEQEVCLMRKKVLVSGIRFDDLVVDASHDCQLDRIAMLKVEDHFTRFGSDLDHSSFRNDDKRESFHFVGGDRLALEVEGEFQSIHRTGYNIEGGWFN